MASNPAPDPTCGVCDQLENNVNVLIDPVQMQAFIGKMLCLLFDSLSAIDTAIDAQVEKQAIVLLDVSQEGVYTPFLRIFSYGATVTHVDVQLNGTTAYVVAGTVVAPGTPTVENPN